MKRKTNYSSNKDFIKNLLFIFFIIIYPSFTFASKCPGGFNNVKISKKNAAESRMWFKKYKQQLKKRKWNAANGLLRKAIGADPSNLDLVFERIRFNFDDREETATAFYQSEIAIKKALEEDNMEYLSKFYEQRAWMSMKVGKHIQSSEYYQKALDVYPDLSEQQVIDIKGQIRDNESAQSRNT